MQSLREAVESLPRYDEGKWREFFEGNLVLSRQGEGFSEYAFYYKGKIWYGNEREGSGSFYCEGTVANLIPIFLNPETSYLESHLNQKMIEVMNKKNAGYMATDGLCNYDFHSPISATVYSCFDNQRWNSDMWDLGEFLYMLATDPAECKWVSKEN